jgi:hypothetical protein
VMVVWRDDDGGSGPSSVALPDGVQALPADDGEIEWWRRGGRK